MGELKNNTPTNTLISSGTRNINNLTRKRVNDLLSRLSTTGLGRSGISGAALNDIYSSAGDSLANVSAQGAQLQANQRSDLINKLLGLYKYQDQSSFDLGDILGTGLGLVAGSALGPIGAAAGGKLASSIFGKQTISPDLRKLIYGASQYTP